MSQPEVAFTDFPIYREQLRNALGFDESDLAANRVGRLGGRERETQLRQLVRGVAITFGFLVFGVAIGSLGLILQFEGGPRFAVGRAWGVLMPARHRLYYLPRSRRVVAAEPVGGADSLNS